MKRLSVQTVAVLLSLVCVLRGAGPSWTATCHAESTSGGKNTEASSATVTLPLPTKPAPRSKLYTSKSKPLFAQPEIPAEATEKSSSAGGLTVKIDSSSSLLPLTSPAQPTLRPTLGPAQVRLRMDNQPKIVIGSQGTAHLLQHLGVTIRNHSAASAQGIKIGAKLPEGKTIELKGVESIPPYGKAFYETELATTLKALGKIEIKISCTNCRK